MHRENVDTVVRADGEHRKVYFLILGISAVVLFWGVWWGWPTSFDQHDPTRRAINMLWHRSLDPGVRYWGAFGYQEVLLLCVVPVTMVKKLLALDPLTAQGVMYLLTRVLWAAHGLGIVVMVYVLSKELFDDTRAALISMAMVPLAPGFVAWSHIPQVDLVHGFWYTLAATLTARAWRREQTHLLWWAAIAAGLAAGVKYVGGIIAVAPMAGSLLLLPPRRAWPRALALGGLAICIFCLTTPLAIGSPLAWLPGYTADTLANGARDTFRPLAFWTLPGVVSDLVGPGTAILGIVGLAGLAVAGVARGSGAAWLLLGLSIIPYYGIFVGQHVATVRYLVPITGTLAVAIGFVVSRGLRMHRLRGAIVAAMGLAATAQAAMVIGLEVGFATETRIALARWLNDHVAEGDAVETLLNHRPYFTGPIRFTEVTRPHFQAESFEMQRDMIHDHDSVLRHLHDLSLKLAGMEGQTVETWVDKERKWLHRHAATFDTSLAGPWQRGAKLVVLNLNTAREYVIDHPGVDPEAPHERDFYLALVQGTGPFRLAAAFDPVVPEWLRYPRELWINLAPPIRVYEVTPPLPTRDQHHTTPERNPALSPSIPDLPHDPDSVRFGHRPSPGNQSVLHTSIASAVT